MRVVRHLFVIGFVRTAVLGTAVLLSACTADTGNDAREDASADSPGAGALPGGVTAPPPSDLPGTGPTERDLEIFTATLAEARAERVDTLPFGDLIVKLGQRFVGVPYTPGTLETPGAERLVVNLREFDCVTYIEAVLGLAQMIRAGENDFETFQRRLTRIRYRDGAIDGYASRLHYFSEWIRDNESKRVLLDVTRELGGVRVNEPIDFMSSNAEAYPALADPAELRATRATETRLSAVPRYYIPQERIRSVEERIRNGDIIAATSSIEGLDVAHTGFAIWIDGRLHLMHAPLVGTVLEISELPLADRITRITGQDGIMVARPL